MIKKFKCDYCNNNNPKKVFEYVGSLGYESLTCKVCGATYDHLGSYSYEENKDFVDQFFIPEKKMSNKHFFENLDRDLRNDKDEIAQMEAEELEQEIYDMIYDY